MAGAYKIPLLLSPFIPLLYAGRNSFDKASFLPSIPLYPGGWSGQYLALYPLDVQFERSASPRSADHRKRHSPGIVQQWHSWNSSTAGTLFQNSVLFSRLYVSLWDSSLTKHLPKVLWQENLNLLNFMLCLSLYKDIAMGLDLTKLFYFPSEKWASQFKCIANSAL